MIGPSSWMELMIDWSVVLDGRSIDVGEGTLRRKVVGNADVERRSFRGVGARVFYSRNLCLMGEMGQAESPKMSPSSKKFVM